ncbi:hypothetical protein M9194_18060 [Vibrio sp. S4M6]|uniref:hypothetical protein n=1 Tax=Vibrio sinus TaxID=2946865 RepID=UPI00202AAF63|nr:hypothetical protein [Vibrio sinus]MCL9783339.1 hypothetical protein [Vibrio sinus]
MHNLTSSTGSMKISETVGESSNSRQSTDGVTGVRNTYHEGPSSGQTVLYAPFSAPDIIDQALGKNEIRFDNGKPMLPVIAVNDEKKAELESHLHDKRLSETYNPTHAINFINEVSEKIEALKLKAKTDPQLRDMPDDQLERLCGEVVREQYGSAKFDRLMETSRKVIRSATILKQMEIRSNENGLELSKLTSKLDKLYVLGHGGAGKDILSGTQDLADKKAIISSKLLSKQFQEGGLPKGFRDFRVAACYSADTREPASFSPDDLKKASEPKYKRSGFLHLGRKVMERQPFAQSLSKSLVDDGFTNPVVTGYHGAGVSHGANGHKAQRLPHANDLTTRSSLVRERFSSDKT